MSELKTLKDFEHRAHPDELREEAIKWVKHFKELQKSFGETCKDYYALNSKIISFMYFFNLTEEDLK